MYQVRFPLNVIKGPMILSENSITNLASRTFFSKLQMRSEVPIRHICFGSSQRKQPTFGNATTGFPAKWRVRNERKNSILMTRHYPDLGSASDWLNQISHAARPIRSTTQIWAVLLIGRIKFPTRHDQSEAIPRFG